MPGGKKAGDLFPVLGRTDKYLRLGIAGEIAQLARGIIGVERKIDCAHLQAGQIQKQRLRRLFHLHRDAVARLGAMARQHMGNARAQSESIAIRQGRAPWRGDEIAIRIRIGLNDAAKKIVRHGSIPCPCCAEASITSKILSRISAANASAAKPAHRIRGEGAAAACTHHIKVRSFAGCVRSAHRTGLSLFSLIIPEITAICPEIQPSSL